MSVLFKPLAGSPCWPGAAGINAHSANPSVETFEKMDYMTRLKPKENKNESNKRDG